MGRSLDGFRDELPDKGVCQVLPVFILGFWVLNEVSAQRKGLRRQRSPDDDLLDSVLERKTINLRMGIPAWEDVDGCKDGSSRKLGHRRPF